MWWLIAYGGGARRRTAIARGVALAGVWLMLAWPAAAQTQAGAADQETVRRLIERVEELERQVRELRQSAAPSPDVPSPQAERSPAIEHDAHAGATTSAAANEHDAHAGDTTSPGARISPVADIHWFGDVGFRASDQQNETSSFTLGQLDLFLTSSLTDHLNVLSELVFRAGADNRYVINAERLLLQYAPNPYLTAGFGRYHTAIGFYNTAYHHGAWFETAITRPTMFAYSGGLIPIHDVGVMASGRVPSRGLRLQYVLEIGNGRTSQNAANEATQNTVDENNGKAFNVGLSARPERFPGLQVGFSTHRDRMRPANAVFADQTTIAAHAVYQGRAFEWLNEMVTVRSARVRPALDSVTTGFYTQMSHQFGEARPYFRYQYINASPADAAFRALGRRNGPTLGLRYDLGKFAAVKAQYDRLNRRGLATVNSLTGQLAFTF